MNRIRRKQIDAILERLEDIRADLESVLEEEEEARDNIPESLMDTERYEKAEEACDNLDNAVSSFEELIEYLENAKE